MNILVCVKQVPDTMEIKIDPETNTLLRNGVPSIANPYDICALELAVRCKKEHGASVTVLTMGPEQAKAVLKECLSLGADHAYLVSDRLFGGSDTLATSYILSTAIRRLVGRTSVLPTDKRKTTSLAKRKRRPISAYLIADTAAGFWKQKAIVH